MDGQYRKKFKCNMENKIWPKMQITLSKFN